MRASSGSMSGPPASPRDRSDAHQRHQMLRSSIEIELQLAVLIHRPESRDGSRALAALAQALAPKLGVPQGEALQAVGVRHHHQGADVLLHVEADRQPPPPMQADSPLALQPPRARRPRPAPRRAEPARPDRKRARAACPRC